VLTLIYNDKKCFSDWALKTSQTDKTTVVRNLSGGYKFHAIINLSLKITVFPLKR